MIDLVFFLEERSAQVLLGGLLARRQRSRKFREPDRLGCPSHELRRLTHDVYQKVGGSRAIAPHLALDGSNRSRSFQVFVSGLRRMVEQALAEA